MNVLEHTPTSSIIARGVLWLIAGILAINGLIAIALSATGRSPDGADAVPIWITFAAAAGAWLLALLIALATTKTLFNVATGTLSVRRFARTRIVAGPADIERVTVGAAPVVVGGGALRAMLVPLSVVVRGREHIVARGTEEEMEALRARVEAGLGAPARAAGVSQRA